jgi:hypothetical protein
MSFDRGAQVEDTCGQSIFRHVTVYAALVVAVNAELRLIQGGETRLPWQETGFQKIGFLTVIIA